MNENVRKCCNDWNINIFRIDCGLRMAAANGTPTKLTKDMEFCPWCGTKLSDRIPMTEEDELHDKMLKLP